MTEAEVRVERILRTTLGIEMPSPTADIIELGLLDSLGLVTLLVELEREFAVTIPLDLDIDDLRSVERLARLAERPGTTESGAA
jgi:acyl carrier protein